MWGLYVFGVASLIPVLVARFVGNRFLKGVLSAASFLGLFVFSVVLSWAVLPYQIGAHGTWIPFALCGAAFFALMLPAWKPFSATIRRIAAASVVGAALIAAAVPAVPVIYQNSLTILQSEEVDLAGYMPFGNSWYGASGALKHYDSLVATLDEASTLALTGELPRLDGATALYPLYSAFVRATYPSPEPSQERSIYSPYQSLRNEHSVIDPLVVCSRTAAAFENLVDGYADMVFLMGVSGEQRAEAEKRGLELILTPVGREAFVFFVNSRNPVDGLSSTDIKRIYSGEATNWSQAGGRNDAIRAYQRPEASGSQVMLRQIMGDAPVAPAPEEDVYNSMLGMVKRVANYSNYRNSLGFSFLYYARDMAKEHNVKFLSIDGIEPTDANIASGAYPFTYDHYAITVRQGGEYLNPERAENIDKLLEWITSPQGQYLVDATGYVPIHVGPQ